MCIVRKFPMRKASYYTAMALWGSFGVDGKEFTNRDGEIALNKHISGGLSSLRESGVLELTDGRKRSVARRRSEPLATWRFTQRFSHYMRSQEGQEEHQIAMEYIQKVGGVPCA